MIISHAHRFIFLKTQKTAGTSVELALSQICGPDDVITPVADEDEAIRRSMGLSPQNIEIPLATRPVDWRLRQMLGLKTTSVGAVFYNHMPAAKIRRYMDSKHFDTYRKVTIIRNPWDREVSLYFWHYRGKDNRPSFDRFVRRPRFRPQRKTFDLYSIDGKIVADTILRYETLREDFSNFTKSLGLTEELELPRAKGAHRKGSARNYRDFYNTELQRVVAQRYANEIEVFGYEF